MSDWTVRAGPRALAATVAAVLFSCVCWVGPEMALAGDSPASPFTLDQPLYLQATQESASASAAADEAPPATPPAPRRPLMLAFEKMGLAPALDKAGINIQGHVEGSWTYDASNPPDNFIQGRVFDVDNQDITLNQIDLTIQRDVSASVKDHKFDVGFNFETIYGGDARFIHGNGANFYGSASPQLDPDEQFDIVQLYTDISVPIGNGMLIRAGKMVTHMGYEVINPTGNALYSHSFLFGYAIPFTHTGVMVFYNISDKLSVMGGFSRGWNQELKDNNSDTIDGLAQVTYKLSDKTTLIFNGTAGPEAAGDPGNWWWVGDVILTQQITDQLSIALNGDYGWYEHGSANGTAAMWYGLAAYAGYKINDMFTINARGEWYDDQDGFTLAGTPNTFYEATLGLAIKPLPGDDIGRNLLIRPEVRYDYSNQAFFDGGTDHGQFTFALDAIFTF